MVRGGILYYTLFLMLISVMVITLILMRHSLYQQTFVNRSKGDELDCNIRSAFLIYRQNPGILSEEDSLMIDLYKDSLAMIELSRESWGIFDIVTASTGWKNLSLSRTGMFGEVIDTKDPALYVADHGLNVSLSGNSLINGDSYIPSGAYRTASIEGQPFIYNKTSIGNVKQSRSQLPDLDPIIDSTVTHLFSGLNPEIDLSDINRKSGNLFENPFCNPPVTYYALHDAILSGLSFRGRIMIYAQGTIFIDRTSVLEDVVLVARRIVVDDGFCGSFQGFAIDSIGTGDNVSLTYPSVLAIISRRDDDGVSLYPTITLGKNNTIVGCIILKAWSENCKVVIPETTVVTGQIYCNGSVELRGDVYGSLFSDGFSFTRESSTYINHLLNSDINMELLPGGFAGFHAGDDKSVRTLIRWLD